MIHETLSPSAQRMSPRLWLTAALFLASGAGLAAWSLTQNGVEQRRFEGPEGPVLSVAFAPDGASIYSAGWDGVVRQWDRESGQELRRLLGHTGPISALAFTPDGRRLVTGSWDRTVRVWDVVSGAE